MGSKEKTIKPKLNALQFSGDSSDNVLFVLIDLLNEYFIYSLNFYNFWPYINFQIICDIEYMFP